MTRKIEWTTEQIELLVDAVKSGVFITDLYKTVGVSEIPARKKIAELGLTEEYEENREQRKKEISEKGFDPQSTTEIYDRLVF